MTGCFKEDIPVEPYTSPEGVFSNMAEVGNLYENQVYFDFESNTFVDSALRHIWDLAISTENKQPFIFLNSSKFMRMAQTDKTNLSDAVDLSDLIWRFDASDGNPENSAFGNWFSNEIELSVPSFVYVIDRGYTPTGEKIGEIKFKILEVSNSEIKVAFTEMNSQTIYEVVLTFDQNFSFAYLSFSDGGSQVIAAPQKSEFDVIFTQYTTKVEETNTGNIQDYSVNGVLLNPHLVSAATEFLMPFEEINYTHLENYDFTQQSDIIGYDWKSYNFSGGFYEINSDNVYLIQTVEGNFYKLRFTGFVNDRGEKGHPQFEFAKF